MDRDRIATPASPAGQLGAPSPASGAPASEAYPTFFAPYEGRAPYLFVSYSHRDTARVLAALSPLRERWLRLWYDEGIPAGSDWPAAIERHLRAADTVLLFLSPTAMASHNCRSEIAAARELHLPLLVVPVDGTRPDATWEPLLKDAVWLAEEADPRAQADVIAAAPGLVGRIQGTEADYQRADASRHRSPWAVAQYLAGAALVVAITCLAALRLGLWNPAPTPSADTESEQTATPQAVDLSAYGNIFVDAIAFPDAEQERAIRMAFGVPSASIDRSRLLELTELTFVGNMTPTSTDGIAFAADGTCTLNGAPVIQGQVSDLTLIADMPYLTSLALVCQPLEDLSGLAGHQVLTELWLAGSTVSNLDALTDLPALSNLHLEHTGVRDLSPLATLPALTRVTVSVDMLPLDVPRDARFDLVLVL